MRVLETNDTGSVAFKIKTFDTSEKALELMLLSVFDESQLRYTDKHREIYFGYIYINIYIYTL